MCDRCICRAVADFCRPGFTIALRSWSHHLMALMVSPSHDAKVLGLRECVEGVDDAMRDGDLKTAARSVHRYLSYEPETLRDHAAAVLDAGTSPIEHLDQQKVRLDRLRVFDCLFVCMCVCVPLGTRLSLTFTISCRVTHVPTSQSISIFSCHSPCLLRTLLLHSLSHPRPRSHARTHALTHPGCACWVAEAQV
jgi:hypothetical protein